MPFGPPERGKTIKDPSLTVHFLGTHLSSPTLTLSLTPRARCLLQILCYFDFSEYADVFDLTTDLSSATAVIQEFCGGFYVDKYFEIAGFAEENIYTLYGNIQVLPPLLLLSPLLGVLVAAD